MPLTFQCGTETHETGVCFSFISSASPTAASFHDASKLCKEIEGYLAIFPSADMWTWLLPQFPKGTNDKFWIGLSDVYSNGSVYWPTLGKNAYGSDDMDAIEWTTADWFLNGNTDQHVSQSFGFLTPGSSRIGFETQYTEYGFICESTSAMNTACETEVYESTRCFWTHSSIGLSSQRWLDAQISCMEFSGQLAILDTLDTFNFVKSNLLEQW
ncbi:hypothetical protein CAPTEDRAFT_196995 [Capitella teleta]|uniref:C-type lectin domain-containing protein n=1 Tax=Capitella teleta TaxID=283909 RepID=R7VJT0_CAPTE|nr:hypothetical protein CAPTEDRAFT_196995 [Capitella teleta]|eukprot:ELU16756.1 hypothetical protein CAPTEDRAFT_196995 [Capitella teleta]